MAYLKKSIALKAQGAPKPGQSLVVAELSGRGLYGRSREAVALPGQYYALAHPSCNQSAAAAKVAQVSLHSPAICGHRQVAMCLRAEEGHRRQDGLEDDARDGAVLRRHAAGATTGTTPTRGDGGKASATSSAASRPDDSNRKLVPMSRVQALLRVGLPRSVYD